MTAIRRALLLPGLLAFLLPIGGPLEAAAATDPLPSAAEIARAFVPVVRRARPAVVNIYTRRVVAARRNPFLNDPFFGELFRELAPIRPRVESSLGSGVILSADGLVVSNWHVVGEADAIRVVLDDRREFDARVVLADRELDLAVLRLEDAQDLPWLELRPSDDVEVGELVLAIGNPFGVGQTVTQGIVSGLARSGIGPGGARGYYIQTDAAINPGNSGGALVDGRGRLIGINTMIVSRSGGSNGIGFAIPADLAARFLEQARAGKTRFERPWAGITGQPLDAEMARALGLDRPEGVIVAELHPASPFAAAGIAPGDVVLEVDGRPVNSPAEMAYRLTLRGIGREVSVTWLHEGRRRTSRVKLIAAPEIPPRDARQLRAGPLAGAVVANLNPRLAAELGIPDTAATGVVLLDPGPVLARLGARPGDILLAVNGRDVSDSREAARSLSVPRHDWRLELRRGGRRLLLRFRI